MKFARLFIIALWFGVAFCDVYLHNPRGNNNRNRETGTNTQNEQRLFESENNSKGGYCWGPPMTFYEGSLLQIEWTAQHGCGADHPNVDCDLILQYMCSPSLRDGTTTDTITAATVDTTTTDPMTGQTVYQYGMNEPLEYYQKCSQRLRNRGLFAADQGSSPTDTAMRTRQNDNTNNPHGFECEEERDYYPYWHPTPWRDIAVLTSNINRCSYFKQHSQNVEGKFECTDYVQNNMASCQNANATWTYVKPWGTDPPECILNGFSRDNHLGNTKTGFTNNYNWIIPDLSDLSIAEMNSDGNTANCVFRIRYNISSDDYPPWNDVDTFFTQPMIDSRYNDANSPITEDPYVGYGTDANGYEWQLSLALNTNQYGRTFQDRSYMFYISKRPAGITNDHRIINLNVRGKRGNIVEVFPAVEYDFVPNSLRVNIGDYVHFQWTGCDTNPNGAGEGLAGTDRSNIVQMNASRHNYPMPFEDVNMFSAQTAFRFAHLNQYNGAICSAATDTGCCKTLDQLTATNGGDTSQDPQNCMKINAPGANYFDGQPQQMKTSGTYYYMSTRNNNFTNRSQKGTITVDPLLPTWGIVVASVGAVGFVVAAGLAGGVYYAATHPAGTLANLLSGVKV